MSMKHIFLIVLTGILLASCADTPSRPEPAMSPEQHERVNAESAAIQAQKAAQQAAGAASVMHYTCPNNCPGSGGDAQGTCPTCGATYAHNQAYHDTGAAAAAPPAATNASGEYHYTCPNGCAGGAGAMGTCTSCGATLAHNDAFHN